MAPVSGSMPRTWTSRWSRDCTSASGGPSAVQLDRHQVLERRAVPAHLHVGAVESEHVERHVRVRAPGLRDSAWTGPTSTGRRAPRCARCRPAARPPAPPAGACRRAPTNSRAAGPSPRRRRTPPSPQWTSGSSSCASRRSMPPSTSIAWSAPPVTYATRVARGIGARIEGRSRRRELSGGSRDQIGHQQPVAHHERGNAQRRVRRERHHAELLLAGALPSIALLVGEALLVGGRRPVHHALAVLGRRRRPRATRADRRPRACGGTRRGRRRRPPRRRAGAPG